jgi:hypothetical protein
MAEIMNAADPNFFICLLLGGLILYGVMPQIGAFVLVLAMLWVLGTAPLLFFVLAGLWLVRRIVFDFVLALIAGLGFGIGARRYNRRVRYPRRRLWSRAELNRHDDEFARTAPRLRGRPADYQPFNDNIDFGE